MILGDGITLPRNVYESVKKVLVGLWFKYEIYGIHFRGSEDEER